MEKGSSRFPGIPPRLLLLQFLTWGVKLGGMEGWGSRLGARRGVLTHVAVPPWWGGDLVSPHPAPNQQ